MVNRLTGKRGPAPEKRSSFKYTPRTVADVRKRADNRGGSFESPFRSNVDVWRPKAGENVIRFLPPTWDGHQHYAYDIWVHSYVGPDNSTYVCPYKTEQKKCPICLAAKEARDAGEADEAKALSPRCLSAAWIIDREEDKPTPMIYLMSGRMDSDIANLCHNKRTGKLLLIDHPDDGYDVSFRREGQGLKTRYSSIAIDREPSPIMDDEKDQQEIEDYILENPIPDLLVIRDAEFLAKVIDGTAETKDEDLDKESEEEEERPRGRKGRDISDRPESRAAPEEEEEEEERPRRGRGRAEPEEGEEEHDPETGELPPKKGRGRAEPEEEQEQAEEEEEQTERSATRRKREAAEKEEEDPKPRGRIKREPVEEEEKEQPRGRGVVRSRRGDPEPEEEEEEEERRPARRAGRR